jgi:hypothetical protein
MALTVPKAASALQRVPGERLIRFLSLTVGQLLRNLHLGAKGALPDRGKRSRIYPAAFISWHSRA